MFQNSRELQFLYFIRKISSTKWRILSSQALLDAFEASLYVIAEKGRGMEERWGIWPWQEGVFTKHNNDYSSHTAVEQLKLLDPRKSKCATIP